MNQLPRSTEYIRATRVIRFGFGVSGDDNVSKGCVAEILKREGNTLVVCFASIGERRIHTPDIEAINEKEYFKGMLRG